MQITNCQSTLSDLTHLLMIPALARSHSALKEKRKPKKLLEALTLLVHVSELDVCWWHVSYTFPMSYFEFIHT